jgi:hypothetical protein
VIGVNDHHVPGARQVSAILVAGASRSGGESTAVAVKHHRPLAPIGGGRPDVEEQTILGLRRLVSSLTRLDGGSPKRQSVA